MQRFTDCHCHLLPGLDDGPSTLDESLEMARLFSNAGFSDIYCTPHCMKGVYDNRPDKVLRAVSDLQKKAIQAGIHIRLHPGMEYYLDEYFPEYLENPQPLGDTNFLLVEASTHAIEQMLKEHLFRIARRKWVPLLAHPERNPLFEQRKPNLLERLKSLLPASLFNGLSDFNVQRATTSTFNEFPGCKLQGNLGSFVGVYGKQVRKTASTLLKSGSYHRLGTDAHSADFLKNLLPIIHNGSKHPGLKQLLSQRDQ